VRRFWHAVRVFRSCTPGFCPQQVANAFAYHLGGVCDRAALYLAQDVLIPLAFGDLLSFCSRRLLPLSKDRLGASPRRRAVVMLSFSFIGFVAGSCRGRRSSWPAAAAIRKYVLDKIHAIKMPAEI